MRSIFIAIVAIGGAIIWGSVEFFALQKQGLKERLRGFLRFRAS
ncbi:MAG: hypothetical protein ABL931_03175 [Usitatibacteraceae bacterium]